MKNDKYLMKNDNYFCRFDRRPQAEPTLTKERGGRPQHSSTPSHNPNHENLAPNASALRAADVVHGFLGLEGSMTRLRRALGAPERNRKRSHLRMNRTFYELRACSAITEIGPQPGHVKRQK